MTKLRMRGVVGVIGMLAVLGFSGAAHAQVSSADRACITAFNSGVRTVAKAHGRQIRKCLHDFAAGRLSALTPEGCVVADTSGKLGKAVTRAVALTNLKCAGGLPGFGATPVEPALVRAVVGQIDLSHGAFGPNLNQGLLASATGATCQARVGGALLKCADRRVREFLSCQKLGLRRGDITDAASLTAACLGTGAQSQPDPTGRIGRDCGAKVATQLTAACVPVDLTQAFSPCDLATSSDVTGVETCLKRESACHLCLVLNEVDAPEPRLRSLRRRQRHQRQLRLGVRRRGAAGQRNLRRRRYDAERRLLRRLHRRGRLELHRRAQRLHAELRQRCARRGRDLRRRRHDLGRRLLERLHGRERVHLHRRAERLHAQLRRRRPGRRRGLRRRRRPRAATAARAAARSRPGYTCSGEPSVCAFVCGNGSFQSGESCDDGDAAGGDGCSSVCQIETGWICVGAAEPLLAAVRRRPAARRARPATTATRRAATAARSTAGVEAGFSCSGTPSNCLAVCGDGFIRGFETCDDATTPAATAALPTSAARRPASCCSGQPSVCVANCGDGNLDGPRSATTATTPAATVAAPPASPRPATPAAASRASACPPAATALLNMSEECDDGNAISGDGCSASCVNEPGYHCTLPGPRLQPVRVCSSTRRRTASSRPPARSSITGHYTTLLPGQVAVTVNGVPASSVNQVLRTFSHTVPLSAAGDLQPDSRHADQHHQRRRRPRPHRRDPRPVGRRRRLLAAERRAAPQRFRARHDRAAGGRPGRRAAQPRRR